MRRWTILNALLGLIALLLALQIARTWARALPAVDLSVRPLEAAPPRGEGGGGREGRGRKRGGIDKQPQTPEVMVTAIVDRDLFDPSRQKPTDAVAAPLPKEALPPPNVTVVGVRILGKDREAFVTDASQGPQQKRLRVGDRLGDYTVKAIDPQRVTLASPEGEPVRLSLSVDKAGQPGSKAGTPPRPGQAAGPAPSPAAGVQPPQPVQPQPAAGMPPRPPRPPAGAGAGARGPTPVVTTTTLPHAAGVPNLPAGVREKLEQLRAQ